MNHPINHHRWADIETQGRNQIAILRTIVLVISLVLILLLILSGNDIISATIAQRSQKIAHEAHALKLNSHVNISTAYTVRFHIIQLKRYIIKYFRLQKALSTVGHIQYKAYIFIKRWTNQKWRNIAEIALHGCIVNTGE